MLSHYKKKKNPETHAKLLGRGVLSDCLTVVDIFVGEDPMLSDQQQYRYMTVDDMKSMGDDSMRVNVTDDERDNRHSGKNFIVNLQSFAPRSVATMTSYINYSIDRYRNDYQGELSSHECCKCQARQHRHQQASCTCRVCIHIIYYAQISFVSLQLSNYAIQSYNGNEPCFKYKCHLPADSLGCRQYAISSKRQLRSLDNYLRSNFLL